VTVAFLRRVQIFLLTYLLTKTSRLKQAETQPKSFSAVFGRRIHLNTTRYQARQQAHTTWHELS